MITGRIFGSLAIAAMASLCIAQPPDTPLESPSDRPAPEQLDAPADSQTLRDALEMLDEPDDAPSEEPTGKGADSEDQSIFAGRSTRIDNGTLTLPPIVAATTETSGIGNGRTPIGYRGGGESPVIGLPETGEERGLPWQWQTGTWVASNSFSHPLYFEDRMLERHGHQRYPALQPMISGGRFIAQWLALPYLSTLHPPCECEYTLGYYRAGSCAPVLRQRAPWSRKAAAAQTASVAGGFIALP